ncbi:MAG: aminopeptidase P family protein [Alphaproteobacteria bacterium]|nr:aminopeptidase P family protein [Alphaproteobacteria bacterium]
MAQDALIELPFASEEYAARLARVRAEMARRGLDLLLVTVPENNFYLTGFETGTVYVTLALALPREGAARFIVRKTELSNVRALARVSWVKEGVGIDDAEDPVAVIARTLGEMGGAEGAVGIERRGFFFSIEQYLQLQAAMPRARFSDASPIIDGLRAVKSEAELACMRRAGAITGQAMREALDTVKDGTLDGELATALYAAALRRGSEPMSMGPYVTTGPRTFLAHSSWRGAPIRGGEVINTEMACVHKRYNVPVFRVSAIGEPPAEIARMHEASRAALDVGLAKIGPGVTSHEGDRVVREVLEKRGYGDLFVVRAAYGIGLGFAPRWSESHVMVIRANDQRRLEPGMCFHLVPALYKEGVGAVCASMPIEITANGCAPLAPIAPELFRL